MNKVFHLLYIIVIVVLVALLFSSKRQIKVVENRVTDTILKIRVDTFTEYIPQYVTKKTTDTIYLQANDKSEVALEIEQFHFSKEGAYDAWISGYNPRLDSIKTYPRVEYRTITNNITKEIYKSTIDLYPYIGFKRLDDKVGQVIGLSIKMPKKWMYSAEIGVMDNKMICGVTVGYKLN
jgi:hypothetical protein